MNSLTKRTKPISQLLKPTSKTLYISLFSTSQSSSQSPSSNPSSSSLSFSRRNDEESRAVRVSVWWDIENCGVPNGVNVFKIAQSITNAVRVNGIKGPVQITAFGDIICLTRANQEALSSTGVNLIHIPHGGKNSADRSLLVDLMYWVSQNPPPAHIFLISGDKDFAGILHKLRMSNYNVLLAAREVQNTSGVLYSAASIMWYWGELAKGENLSGKHFNQPPDGPFNSWYGHYRGPLQDPFAVSELQKYSESEESLNGELSPDINLQPVPMPVLRQLCRIVNSNPKGLTITELRDQLIKSKVCLDKDFYGHKKFSRFLMGFPRIVKVESRGDGQFFLTPVSPRSPNLVEGKVDVSAQATPVNEKPGEKTYAKKVDEKNNKMKEKIVEETSEKNASVKKNTMETENKVDLKNNTTENKRAEETSEENALGVSLSESDGSLKEALNMEIAENRLTPIEECNSKHEKGFIKRLWTKFFGHSIYATKQLRDDGPEGLSTSSDIPEKSISEEQSKASNITELHDPVHSSSEEDQTKSINKTDAHDPAHSFSNTALNLAARAGIIEKSEASPGFIGKIINWCKYWGNETAINKPVESPTEVQSPVEEACSKLDEDPHSKKLDDDASQSRKHDLFTKESFWSGLRSFLKTHRGSDIVLKSQSREQIAERLQKEGPSFLQPLQANDIRHLVDLLAEKKWIKEFPTKHPRFKLGSLYEETSVPSQPNNPTGLSSIFLNSQIHENPQLKVSSVVHKKPSAKSRTEILSDCQKLLDEVLSQNPGGLSINHVKKQFLDKYGYALDHQKLGYPKLVSLLQMMPGVKVESTRVLPDNVVYAPGIQSLGEKEKSVSSDSEISDVPLKGDEVESLWEELGPVDGSNNRKEEGEYEASVFEDVELSDTEEEEHSASSFPVKVEESKSKLDRQESSLLQILDSWYSTKDESNPRENGPDPEGSSGSSDDEIRPPGLVTGSIKDEIDSTVNTGRKPKPQKTYTFVAESTELKKGKLIDGILGSLKKNGEVRV